MTETSYRMLNVLSFLCSGEGLTFFTKNNRVNFTGEKSKMKLSEMHNNKSNLVLVVVLRSLLTFEVPIVTNSNFLLTISIHCQEIRL